MNPNPQRNTGGEKKVKKLFGKQDKLRGMVAKGATQNWTWKTFTVDAGCDNILHSGNL